MPLVLHWPPPCTCAGSSSCGGRGRGRRGHVVVDDDGGWGRGRGRLLDVDDLGLLGRRGSLLGLHGWSVGMIYSTSFINLIYTPRPRVHWGAFGWRWSVQKRGIVSPPSPSRPEGATQAFLPRLRDVGNAKTTKFDGWDRFTPARRRLRQGRGGNCRRPQSALTLPCPCLFFPHRLRTERMKTRTNSKPRAALKEKSKRHETWFTPSVRTPPQVVLSSCR